MTIAHRITSVMAMGASSFLAPTAPAAAIAAVALAYLGLRFSVLGSLGIPRSAQYMAGHLSYTERLMTSGRVFIEYLRLIFFPVSVAGDYDFNAIPLAHFSDWDAWLGLFLIGIPPGAEEIARSFVFLLVTIVYAGVWLALALLFSVVFRSAATAALVTLGLWLLVTFIWPVLAGALAQIIVPPDPRYTALGLQTPGTAQLEQILARFSPSTLYAEIVVALLDPTTQHRFVNQLPNPLAPNYIFQPTGIDAKSGLSLRGELRQIE